MTDRSKTPEEIVALADEQGFIGYVHGGDNRDWPGMQTAISDGLIKFERDWDNVEPGKPRRSWYSLTKKGKAMKEAKP